MLQAGAGMAQGAGETIQAFIDCPHGMTYLTIENALLAVWNYDKTAKKMADGVFDVIRVMGSDDNVAKSQIASQVLFGAMIPGAGKTVMDDLFKGWKQSRAELAAASRAGKLAKGGGNSMVPRVRHDHGHGHTLREINNVRGSRNCASCALATDSTLAGNAASAINTARVQGVRWADFPALAGRSWHGANSAKNKLGDLLSIDDIRALVPNPGDRGIVAGLRGGQSGHYFNVVNQNGIIRFLDGQSGTAATLQGYIGFMFMLMS